VLFKSVLFIEGIYILCNHHWLTTLQVVRLRAVYTVMRAGLQEPEKTKDNSIKTGNWQFQEKIDCCIPLRREGKLQSFLSAAHCWIPGMWLWLIIFAVLGFLVWRRVKAARPEPTYLGYVLQHPHQIPVYILSTLPTSTFYAQRDEKGVELKHFIFIPQYFPQICSP